MKKTVLLAALAMMAGAIFAQKKVTTSATISFDASTPKDEMPKAKNNTVVASLDTKTGTLAFEALIKGFTFGNPNMQEHFNGGSWMNSEKFPSSVFTGTITNLSEVNFKKDGTYMAIVEGDLTLHGVTQKVKTTGSFIVAGKVITATADFSVKLADYGVNGGAIAAGKVANEPKITVSAELK